MEDLTLRAVPIEKLAIAEGIGNTTLGPDPTSSQDTFAAFVNAFVLGAFDYIDSFAVVHTIVMEK